MYDLINDLLKRNGGKKISTKKNLKENTQAKSTKKIKTRLNESDLLYSDIQNITESAIKETLKSVITESTLPDNEKYAHNDLIENSNFKEADLTTFIENTIEPIMETVDMRIGGSSKVVKSNNKEKLVGVCAPVYEVALTLEAARMGALTFESLDDVPVKEEVGPVIDEIGETAEANKHKGEVDPDQKTLDELVDDKHADTYGFGRNNLKENIDADLGNVHQYEKNNKDMPTLSNTGADTPEKQKKAKESIVNTKDPKSVKDINVNRKKVEDSSRSAAEELIDETMPVLERGSVMAKLFGSLIREELDTTEEEEYVPKSDKNIKQYEGDNAGGQGSDAFNNSAYQGDGTADEHIIEQQVSIAKHLLGKIFNEYGIKDNDTKKRVVLEAIHYVFKHGVLNLLPAHTDIANIVVEQDKLSDEYDIPNAKSIVELTRPVLTPVQEATINGKAQNYLQALSFSHQLISDAESDGRVNMKAKDKFRDKRLNEAYQIREAVNYIAKANLVERTRQAFRYRMNKFNEASKRTVSNKWAVLNENNNESIDILKEHITIRSYVTDAQNMKQYFNTLREDSPVFKPSFKKRFINNDNLSAATLMIEMGIVWRTLKNNFYNKQPLDSKYNVLTEMTNIANGYKSLMNTFKNPEKYRPVLENFIYRLESLKDKIETKLNK